MDAWDMGMNLWGQKYIYLQLSGRIQQFSRESTWVFGVRIVDGKVVRASH
jgi:hypothetical protein